ncbi:hypothetical protein [Priestia filamentosa]|nr:hypothetical protein [Priestia filamentosa]MDT3762618.1 hypothetical protein [Priestia filamentosa]WRU97082.1 hypothetical protein RYX51_08410 [Priestia filamentosa]
MTSLTKYDFLKITITLTIIAYLALFQLPDFVHGFIDGMHSGRWNSRGF